MTMVVGPLALVAVVLVFRLRFPSPVMITRQQPSVPPPPTAVDGIWGEFRAASKPSPDAPRIQAGRFCRWQMLV